MNNLTYTSDQFQTWQICQKKYYLKYIKRLSMPEVENNFELGKSVHALAHYYLRGLKISHLEELLDSEIKQHWDSIKSSEILKNKLIAVEWGFNAIVKDTNKWLNGRIDAVFYDEQIEKYVIVDWKTGQNIPKNPEDSFQCKMYLYSFFNAQKDLGLDFKNDEPCFQYVKTPDLEMIEPIMYSKEKNEEYAREFKGIINDIEATQSFKVTDNYKNCKFCPYKYLCKKESFV